MKATQTRFDISFQEERNLPLWGETSAFLRVMLSLPLLFALETGYAGHRMFATIQHLHPSSYSLTSHLTFGVFLLLPAVWLLVIKKPLTVKKDFAFLLIFAYAAASTAIAQATMAFILP